MRTFREDSYYSVANTKLCKNDLRYCIRVKYLRIVFLTSRIPLTINPLYNSTYRHPITAVSSPVLPQNQLYPSLSLRTATPLSTPPSTIHYSINELLTSQKPLSTPPPAMHRRTNRQRHDPVFPIPSYPQRYPPQESRPQSSRIRPFHRHAETRCQNL